MVIFQCGVVILCKTNKTVSTYTELLLLDCIESHLQSGGCFRITSLCPGVKPQDPVGQSVKSVLRGVAGSCDPSSAYHGPPLPLETLFLFDCLKGESSC